MNEALAMGNYGAYVWTSFGLTFVVMVTCVIQARRRHAITYKDIETRLRAMESRK